MVERAVRRFREIPAYGSRFGAFALVGLAAALFGCGGETCDRNGQAPQRFAGGHTNESRSFYESSAFEGPYLYFPSGRTYRLEHGLSEAPAEYGVVLSFHEYPFDSGTGIAESAGNQAVVENITDTFVEVRNDTCAEFFLRLTARTAPFDETTPLESVPTGDAGSPVISTPDAG